MVVKVTPKPPTLSRMLADRCSSPRSLARSARSPAPSATAHLLAVLVGPGDVVPGTDGHGLPAAARAPAAPPRPGGARRPAAGSTAGHRGPGGPRRADESLPGQRRDRVSAGERVEALGCHLVPARLQRRLAPLVRLVG